MSSSSSSLSSSWDDNNAALLNRRLMELKKSESLQQQLNSGQMELPAICMDALLPKQRLQLRTSDPTLGCFLRDGVGLGGLFVMTSLNPTTRMIRRHGVCVKVQALDVVSHNNTSSPKAPTAVDFEIVGVCRCRLVGPRDGMRQRLGRWRREYDPNGEESMLGWGMERFQKANDELVLKKEDTTNTNDDDDDDDENSRPYTEWSTCLIDVDLEQMDQNQDEQIMLIEANSRSSKITNQMDTIAQMLLEWQELASNGKTFENLNVTASTRIQRGHAGLLVNPQVLIKNVVQELGPRPTSSPTAFCYWATALMNPLPPLGVSLEIRGSMLEAATLQQRLNILERGLIRSIDNLKGIRPLI